MSALRAKKSPHCGDLMAFLTGLMPVFHLLSFFALQSLRIISRFVIYQNSFFRRFSTILGQFLHLRKKTPHRGVQGHTGASFPVMVLPIFFRCLSLENQGNVQSLLTSLSTRVYIPQAALPTSNKRRSCYGHTAIVSFPF